MTSTAVTNLTTAGESRPLITPRGWVWIGLLTLLFVALHRNFLYRSLLISLDDNDWSHALLVPVIGVYYLFQNRGRLMQLSSSVCGWGLPIMLAGMVSYAFWIFPGRNDMFQGYSMIVALFGLVLFVVGPRLMTVLWFPILYLGFGVKVSQKLWEMIALKLQTIAAVSSTALLNIIGMALDLEASVRGNTIELYHQGMKISPPMNVAEACSGLRMLMAFLALGVAMAFLAPRAWWQRVVMVGMTLPIAVGVNVGRVTTLGFLHVYAPEYAKGDFHIFVGMLMLIPAAGMFLLLGWVLDKLIISDGPEAGIQDSDPGQGIGPMSTFEPTDGDRPTIVKGVLFGGGLTGLACLAYVLVFATVRPDLVVELAGQSEAVVRGIAGTGLAVVLVLMWFGARHIWPSLIPQDSSVSTGRKRVAALAMGAGFLVTATAGQVAILEANDVVMFKKDVPLRKELDLLEHPTGNWRFVKQDPPLDKAIVDELGTTMYVNRTYEDTSWAGDIRGRYADLHIAYYTGTPDTVPHVPQQCFKAGGLEQVAGGAAFLELRGEGYREDAGVTGGYVHPVKDTGFGGEARLPGLDVPATYFTFAAPGRNGQQVNVAYFFVANGKYFKGPNEVRFNGFDLRDKYSFYCKIQVTVRVQDKDEAIERISSLMSELMPEIMSCLPDWVDVTEGRWPAEVSDVAGSGTVAGE
jgi:exosortase